MVGVTGALFGGGGAVGGVGAAGGAVTHRGSQGTDEGAAPASLAGLGSG